MSSTSSNRSAPPPYSTNPPPNLDTPQPGQFQQDTPQQPQQLAQQYQLVQQYPILPQVYIPKPQLQPIFYAPQPLPFPIFQPLTPGTLIPKSSYPSPFGYQIPLQHPPPAPAIYPQTNVTIIPAPTQAGFVPHPPAIMPGIPGVHQYPLFVSKEGEGSPAPALLPIFVAGYGGYVVQV